MPEGEEEGNVRGAAVRPPPPAVPPAAAAAPLDGAVAETNQGGGIDGLIESLEALNLVSKGFCPQIMHYAFFLPR